jgi:dihydroxyacid dehydratase/phosphogluconate dehydratase
MMLKAINIRGGKGMQEKLQRVTNQTIIVGIDIAKKEHWARITDSRGSGFDEARQGS